MSERERERERGGGGITCLWVLFTEKSSEVMYLRKSKQKNMICTWKCTAQKSQDMSHNEQHTFLYHTALQYFHVLM